MDRMQPEQLSLLDQYVSTQLARLSGGASGNFFDPSLPPTPDAARRGGEQWVLRLRAAAEEGGGVAKEAGPYSYAQMHAWIGAGHLGPERLVRPLLHGAAGAAAGGAGWRSVAESGLCAHRWFVTDPNVGAGGEIQGPFTPYQISSWFAHGELYWHYCRAASPRDHEDETDWYFLDDGGEQRGPFEYNQMCAWFSAGVMSNKRLVCRADDAEWSAATACGFGNSRWFVVGDDEDNVTGPLSPLQVQQWFTTGWLQRYLMDAGREAEDAGSAAEEEAEEEAGGKSLYYGDYGGVGENYGEDDDYEESDEATSSSSAAAEWFYLDDDMAPQGPFTRQAMMGWFRDGALTYMNRYVAQGDGEWEDAADSALYDPALDVWFVENGETGNPVGPWRADEVMSMLSEGELDSNHRVALAGASAWVPLGALLGGGALDDAYWEDAFGANPAAEEEGGEGGDGDGDGDGDGTGLDFGGSVDGVGKSLDDLAWHVNDGEYTLGPYSWEDMRQLYLEGRLDPNEHWVSVGGQDWIHPAEGGFVEDENDWGGWYVLTPAVGQYAEGAEYDSNGPYLASDIAHYMSAGLISVDAFVACGGSDWCNPEEFGFVFPEAAEAPEDEMLLEDAGEAGSYDDSEVGMAPEPEPRATLPVPYRYDEVEGGEGEGEGAHGGDYGVGDAVDPAIGGAPPPEYYVHAAGEVLGPYPLDDLLSWLRNGFLEPDTEVTRADDESDSPDWQPISRVAALSDDGMRVEEVGEEDAEPEDYGAEQEEEDDDAGLEDYKDAELEDYKDVEGEEDDDLWFMLEEDDNAVDNNTVLGPFKESQLCSMIIDGVAHSERLICPNGGEEWVCVVDMFPEYFPDGGEEEEVQVPVAQVRSLFEGGSGQAPSGKVPSARSPVVLEHGPMYASRISY